MAKGGRLLDVQLAEVRVMRKAKAVLDVIRDRGRRGLHLEDVYRQLFNPALYLEAYARIYRNDGAMTAGATRETVDGMSLRKIEGVIDLVRHERFRWTPVRREYIPKTNGKMRPLGIPTWSDKLLQEVMRHLLDAYYEPQFSDLSHGFRPGRGCHTALHRIYKTWKGVKWFIEGDIKGCFDNIDHSVLLAILRERIHDGRFIELVKGALQAGYLDEWDYRPTWSGTPQGGIVSPILSNIYLDRLDRFVEDTLTSRYTRGDRRRSNPEYMAVHGRMIRLKKANRMVEWHRARKEARSLPSQDNYDLDYRRLYYIRYADDFLLGFAGPRGEAEEIKEEIRNFLASRLKLELSVEKTLITHARTETVRFLGYEVGVMDCATRRSVNGQIELRLPRDVLKKVMDRYRVAGKPVPRFILTHSSDFDIVAMFGMEYRGIVQYYKLARNVYWLGHLHWVMETALLRTLACKHRSSVTKMSDKYASKCLTLDGKMIKCIQVVVRRDDQGKPPLVATFGGFSLQRDLNAVLVDEKAAERLQTGRSELLQRLLADRCEVCGGKGKVEVHHVRKLKDLRRPGRKTRPYWVQVMIARRRKTLVLCERCHDDLHAGRLDGRPGGVLEEQLESRVH
jgi:group II intron reverse transcriptase/maturase